MKTDGKDGLDKIFLLARQAAPDVSRVEQGFEARVIMRLQNRREGRHRWYASSWKLVPVFAVVVVLLGGWYYENAQAGPDMRDAITADYETTVGLIGE